MFESQPQNKIIDLHPVEDSYDEYESNLAKNETPDENQRQPDYGLTSL